MCDESIVDDDWVQKGCHIHVNGVELVIRPDHRGGVVFKKFFAKTSDAAVRTAILMAEHNCLPNAIVRKRWIAAARRAILHMLGYEGVMPSLANGRMLEFKFLALALERYRGKDGRS